MTDSTADALARLHDAFGDHLYAAATRLVDLGCVYNVRVLQAGTVVTGRAGSDPQANEHASKREAAYRIYVRQRNDTRNSGAQARAIEGECDCGERELCMHVAAVLIAAAKNAHGASSEARSSSNAPSLPRPADALMQNTSAQGQRLCYLLDSTDSFQLSVWVGQAASDSHRVDPESACPFVPRSWIHVDKTGSDWSSALPRYVDAQDKEILTTLATQHIDGQWKLQGAFGAALLRRVVATNRTFWRSLNGEPLRAGATRRVDFEWEQLPNGDQRLRCRNAESTSLILDVEPAVYVDTAVNECGTLELPCTQELLRKYWHQPIAPERAATVNEHLSRDFTATFPPLRIMAAQRQPLLSLKPKLVLSAGPDATLRFIYNGLSVDSRRLLPEQRTVRQMDGDVLYEIDRDRDAERRLQEQLDRAFANVAPSGEPTDGIPRERWLELMTSTVPALQADGWEVLIEDRFPYRIAAPERWYGDLQRCDDRQREWFDLRLGIVVDGHAVNLLPVLTSFLQAQSWTGLADVPSGEAPYCRAGEHLFVRLDDGRYVPVAIERVERIAHTLVELFDRNGLNAQRALSLPRSQASRLAQLADELGGPALRSNEPSVLALIDDLENSAQTAPLAALTHFRATLREYQHTGLRWLQFLRRHGLGGILADDMGLGKTVQTLAHLVLEKEQGRLRKPSLIVAPVSVIGNWRREIERLAPTLKVLTLHGPRRAESFAAIGQADVVITAYPLLQLDGEMLLAHEFCFLILDEAQTIKNSRAKVSQAARRLHAEHRLCLTGTPMENHLGELWSLLDFVQPGLLGEERHFQRHYRTPIEKHGDQRRLDALTRRTAPFILRRTKDAVARELPAKTQIVESVVLDDRQRDLYDGIRLAMHRRVREIIEQQGLARSHITVLDALLKLRQACCDPRLLGADADTQAIPSAKMDWLQTVLPELVAEGRRILLFSQFTSMLKLIETAVTELSIPHCVLTGETRHRDAVVERFQAGEAPLFLISLKAGGTGLNLTAADTVIHYDPWWNPAVEAQATDRAHRIGQDKPVFVYKLIAQGTVEEKILRLQEDKHALASRLYAEHGAWPAALGTKEVEDLFA